MSHYQETEVRHLTTREWRETISPEQRERFRNLWVEEPRMPPGWWLIPALILGPVVMVALAYAGGAF